MKDLYTENYTAKKIEEEINKCKSIPFSWAGRITIS